jgi:hypothetical protein
VATAHGVSSINLLPRDSFEFSTTGKLLKWVTTAGRVLVVLTEFIVLLAFASRFYFDKKLDDLGEVLVQKEEQIAAYVDVETEMRKLLAKQKPIEAFETGSINFAEKIDNLTRILPTGTIIDTVIIGNQSLTVSGKSPSEYAFAQLISGVKKMPEVTSVNMSDTSYDQKTGGMKFNIQVSYK